MITKQEESTGYLMLLEVKGGEGSGNFGHVGVPGQVGGSGSGSGGHGAERTGDIISDHSKLKVGSIYRIETPGQGNVTARINRHVGTYASSKGGTQEEYHVELLRVPKGREGNLYEEPLRTGTTINYFVLPKAKVTVVQ